MRKNKLQEAAAGRAAGMKCAGPDDLTHRSISFPRMDSFCSTPPTPLNPRPRSFLLILSSLLMFSTVPDFDRNMAGPSAEASYSSSSFTEACSFSGFATSNDLLGLPLIPLKEKGSMIQRLPVENVDLRRPGSVLGLGASGHPALPWRGRQ